MIESGNVEVDTKGAEAERFVKNITLVALTFSQ